LKAHGTKQPCSCSRISLTGIEKGGSIHRELLDDFWERFIPRNDGKWVLIALVVGASRTHDWVGKLKPSAVSTIKYTGRRKKRWNEEVWSCGKF
jgi:hypothetical protein